MYPAFKSYFRIPKKVGKSFGKVDETLANQKTKIARAKLIRKLENLTEAQNKRQPTVLATGAATNLRVHLPM